MTRDPDRVAGSDSLLEVAYTMRSLRVALLPVCDQDGALQGIIALQGLPRVVRGADPAGVTRPRSRSRLSPSEWMTPSIRSLS